MAKNIPTNGNNKVINRSGVNGQFREGWQIPNHVRRDPKPPIGKGATASPTPPLRKP